MNFLNVGDELELEIKKYGINGEGIAKHKKLNIFVPNALIGERVLVKITECFDNYSNGEVIEYLKKSENRVEPFCAYYGKCGGCQTQHMGYKYSLKMKRDLIIEAIQKYTSLNPYEFQIQECIGMENPKHYRNKSQLPVKINGDRIVVGIYRPGTNHLISFDECPIHNEEINRVNKKIVELMEKHNVKPFDYKKKTGNVRYIVTRVAFATKKLQVTLVLGKLGHLDRLLDDIKKIENVISVYTDYNPEKNGLVFGNSLKKYVGEDYLRETLGRYKFDLMPNAFFQLNPIQTEKLYDAIKKACKLSRKEKVLDAYCGVGTIGIWVSNMALEVKGIEQNKEAILSANENAKLNKVKNIEFICGETLEELPKLVNNGWMPDVVLLDPPRVGLGMDLCNILLKYTPKRIVYTSCNPATLAKDLNYLSLNYQVKYIQPVDMFPYTANVEAVCLLEKKK